MGDVVNAMRQKAEQERVWAHFATDTVAREVAEARAAVYEECAQLTERAWRMAAAS